MLEYSVIIPAYNEEDTIEHAVKETWRELSTRSKYVEIIVVDDGSIDETRRKVEELSHSIINKIPVRLVALAQNQGKGAAVRTGVLAAQGQRIGFLDADLATHPHDLIQGFELLESCEVAFGSRRMETAAFIKPQAWHRSTAGQFFNLAMRFWLDLPYHDTQCGCKAFRQNVARTLFAPLKTTGWSFDVEILYRAHQQGYRIQEFPVAWTNGKTSRVRWSDAGKIFQELYRIKHLDS